MMLCSRSRLVHWLAALVLAHESQLIKVTFPIALVGTGSRFQVSLERPITVSRGCPLGAGFNRLSGWLLMKASTSGHVALELASPGLVDKCVCGNTESFFCFFTSLTVRLLNYRLSVAADSIFCRVASSLLDFPQLRNLPMNQTHKKSHR